MALASKIAEPADKKTSLHKGPFFQAKLKINEPGDVYEQEADAVADKVMRMPSPSSLSNNSNEHFQLKPIPFSKVSRKSNSEEDDIHRKEQEEDDQPIQKKPIVDSTIQRKCATCDDEIQRKEDDDSLQLKSNQDFSVQRKCAVCIEEEKVQRKENCEEEQPIQLIPIKEFAIQRQCTDCDKEDDKIQRKESNNTGGGLSAPSIVSDVISSSGTSLDKATQQFMESRMMQDFSNVQVHTDSKAAESAQAINALAYTSGNHVVFNSGQYQPNTEGGQRLLAHELVHVGQQNRNISRKQIVQGKGLKLTKVELEEAQKQNRENWYELGFKHLNLFSGINIDPINQPQAYAEQVLKLQETLIYIVNKNEELKKTVVIKANGILDKVTFNLINKWSFQTFKDPKFKSLWIDLGVEEGLNKRLMLLVKNTIDSEPLRSQQFNSHPVFQYINTNSLFVLSKNDKGDAVKILKQVLKSLNYDIGEEAIYEQFGDDTVKALKMFQAESGFTGSNVDGILGRKTLEALDKRMATSTHETILFSAHGPSYSFKIPITRKMTRDEKLIWTLQVIFTISEKQANDMKDNNWNWSNNGYSETTKKDLEVGFEYVTVLINQYEKIAGNVVEKYGKHIGGEPIEPQIKELGIDINKYEKLYHIIKEIEAIDSTITKTAAAGMVLPFTTGTSVTHVSIAIQKREAKVKERNEELKRLNITIDIFYDISRVYKNLFASFALGVAFDMLDASERKASIEMLRYEGGANDDKLKEGTAIKGIFNKLDHIRIKADKEWWQGISYEETIDHNPDTITSRDSLETYLAQVKGIKSKLVRQGKEAEYTDPAGDKIFAYERYRRAERGGNGYFEKSFDTSKEFFDFFRTSAETYPVLAYPKLEIEKNLDTYKKMSPADIEKMLSNTGTTVKENIAKTREHLLENPNNVYKLKPVIQLAKFKLGVLPDSIQDGLINDAVKEFEDAEFWRNIGMAALGITLGLLALASGPVGWAALAGSIVVGSVDAYMQYQEITFTRGAANTDFDPSLALSEVEPGYFWFYVSLIGVGLDVFQGLKAVSAAAKAAKATEEGSKLAIKVSEALQADKRALQSMLSQAGPEAGEIEKQIAQIEKALLKVDSGEFAKQINILRHVNDTPQVVIRLSGIFKDQNIAESFAKLEKLVGKGQFTERVFKDVLRFYGGTGKDFVAELPEFMHLAEKIDLSKNHELFTELLSNPRSQKVMLDFGEHQDGFLKLWDEFVKARSSGHAFIFSDFLKEKGFSTAIQKTTTLVEEFGTSFATLPARIRNTRILRLTEPALADAFANGKLPPRVQEALQSILESDILGKTTDLARSKERLSISLRALGASLESQSDYQAVIRLLKDVDSKKVVFEKATGLAGHEEFSKFLLQYEKELVKDSKALDDFLRIGPFTDPETFDWLMHNKDIRKLIADSPELIKALKKCASPCFPIHAKIEDIKRILNIIKKEGGNVDYAKLNQYMYLKRPRSTSPAEMEKWTNAIDTLEANYKVTIKGVPMPTGKDISLPPRFQTGGVTELKDAASKLDILVQRGFAPKQLEDMLVQAGIHRIDGTDFVKNLQRATAKLTRQRLDNISGIINGLSSTKKTTFETAYHFILRIGDYADGSGVKMAEEIFAKFDIQEIATLRLSNSASLSFDVASQLGGGSKIAGVATDLGHASAANMETFYLLATRIKGTSEDILKLAQKASTVPGETNILQLADILERLPKGQYSIVEMEMKIVEAADFAKKLSFAGTKMGDELWGKLGVIKDKAGKYKVSSKFIDIDGKVSGSKAIAFIKTNEDTFAHIIAKGGNIDKVSWTNFRNAIVSSDLEIVTKNHIIGEMWDKANLEALKQAGFEVYSQITIRIKGTEVEAVLDAVLKKNNDIFFKEFKSGDSQLSAAQKKIYGMLQDPTQAKELEAVGNKAEKVWPKGSDFKGGVVEVVREIFN